MARWYKALLEKRGIKEDGEKANKFGATPTDGFPSKLERDVFAELKWLEFAGNLKDVKRYDTVRLTMFVRWKCDFTAWHVCDDEKIWIEAKGFYDRRFRVIKDLWREYGPGKLWIYKRGPTRDRVYRSEIIEGGKSNGKIR